MADNPNIDPNASAAQGGEGGQEPDYKALYEQLKAESRKWEDRSKQNKAKADKLDELMAGNDSIEERIAALEAENKAMKDAEARQKMIAEVASETGLPADRVAVLAGADKETLLEQAKELAAYIDSIKPKGAPNAPEAGLFPRGAQSNKSAAQQFGDAIDMMLGH